jgi:hypothetical protein
MITSYPEGIGIWTGVNVAIDQDFLAPTLSLGRKIAVKYILS